MKVGVQLHPQHTTVANLRAAWTAADELGVDSIWVWDHFFPLYGEGMPYVWPPEGEPAGAHFEGWSLLAAMAVETRHASIGVLISNVTFRNPDLLADMARTVDHLSGGRVVLGLGAGNLQRDSQEYGYPVLGGRERAEALRDSLSRIRNRLTRLDPAPLGPLPILVGGSGSKVTFRLVAEHAQAWNSFGPPSEYARLNNALDEWCAIVGRNPAEIERTVLLDSPAEMVELDAFAAAGAEHIIVGWAAPFQRAVVEELVALRGGRLAADRT